MYLFHLFCLLCNANYPCMPNHFLRFPPVRVASESQTSGLLTFQKCRLIESVIFEPDIATVQGGKPVERNRLIVLDWVIALCVMD